MSVSGAFAQGSRMAEWGEDQWYTEPDEDCMSPEDIEEEMAERQRESGTTMKIYGDLTRGTDAEIQAAARAVFETRDDPNRDPASA